MTRLFIRPAEACDAAAARDVLRQSISELCTADHRGDPAILERWIATKTPETVPGWIVARGHTLLIAERADAVVGVGGMTTTGEITSNDVAPTARCEGVSTAMLAALEDRLRGQGVRRRRLSSTATAHGVCHGRSHVDVGRAVAFGGMTDYHMAKQL